MAVFIPVAVLASGFLADSVSAAPIVDQSYAANGLSELDDEKLASIFSAIGNVLAKPGVIGGILGTFGTVAGSVGSILGATGNKKQKDHKRELAFDNMTDEEKVASLWKYVPDIAGALGGALGLGLGAYQHRQNGKQKRTVAYEDLSDEDIQKMASIFGAIRGVLAKPGVIGGILGTFGTVAGSVGSILGATGNKKQKDQKRELAFDNMSDEEKVAAFWNQIKPVTVGGPGLHNLIRQKRAADLLGQDEDKEAFWQLVPAIAGALGGALGLGLGVHQHIQNGKPKRAIDPQEFGFERRDLEDMELLARMVDDSEFY